MNPVFSKIIIKLLAIASGLNGLWMLLHAWSWFDWLPGVSDTGTANAHFIHDVGIVYCLCAGGLWWSLNNLAKAYPLFVGISLFYLGHALGHVFEILLGQLPASHWLIDLPLVFVPALFLGWIAMPKQWDKLLKA